MTAALPDRLERAVDELLARGTRALLGIAGAPGSGKSTLAAKVAERHPDRSVVVPMDGFHLANAELDRLGRRGRKGAPDTFDAAGFVALLRRLRAAEPCVYAPRFEREVDQPIAGSIPVAAAVPLVIVEGNYLLLGGPWAPVRGLLDQCCFLATPDERRHAWLHRRHMSFGRSAEEADAWIAATDEPNARAIAPTAAAADFTVTIEPDARR